MSSSTSSIVLERVEVALEHPLEQVGEQLEPVEPSGVARAAGALAEPLENLERLFVDRDDPALRYEAVDAHERAILPGRAGRHVDVVLEIAELWCLVACPPGVASSRR